MVPPTSPAFHWPDFGNDDYEVVKISVKRLSLENDRHVNGVRSTVRCCERGICNY